MLTPVCQRWRERRGIYRPLGEPIRTAEYDVAEIDERAAKDFVTTHHYSGRYPAARWRFGLATRGELVGVAVFSVPFPNAVGALGLDRETVELGRLVLLDEVPSNGESWFLARCFAAVRHRAPAVLSFSDPERRTDAEGKTVFAGHIGTVYQATNGAYRGRGARSTHYLAADGSEVSARAIQKIRAGERGWRSAAAQLEQLGAGPPGADRVAWLHHWLPRLTRTFRHGGNHRYVWRFGNPLPSLPYPKWSLA